MEFLLSICLTAMHQNICSKQETPTPWWSKMVNNTRLLETPGSIQEIFGNSHQMCGQHGNISNNSQVKSK